jgi:hypothetical protein
MLILAPSTQIQQFQSASIVSGEAKNGTVLLIFIYRCSLEADVPWIEHHCIIRGWKYQSPER